MPMPYQLTKDHFTNPPAFEDWLKHNTASDIFDKINKCIEEGVTLDDIQHLKQDLTKYIVENVKQVEQWHNTIMENIRGRLCGSLEMVERKRFGSLDHNKLFLLLLRNHPINDVVPERGVMDTLTSFKRVVEAFCGESFAYGHESCPKKMFELVKAIDSLKSGRDPQPVLDKVQYAVRQGLCQAELEDIREKIARSAKQWQVALLDSGHIHQSSRRVARIVSQISGIIEKAMKDPNTNWETILKEVERKISNSDDKKALTRLLTRKSEETQAFYIALQQEITDICDDDVNAGSEDVPKGP